jgi:hypothetical protein
LFLLLREIVQALFSSPPSTLPLSFPPSLPPSPLSSLSLPLSSHPFFRPFLPTLSSFPFDFTRYFTFRWCRACFCYCVKSCRPKDDAEGKKLGRNPYDGKAQYYLSHPIGSMALRVLIILFFCIVVYGPPPPPPSLEEEGEGEKDDVEGKNWEGTPMMGRLSIISLTLSALWLCAFRLLSFSALSCM